MNNNYFRLLLTYLFFLFSFSQVFAQNLTILVHPFTNNSSSEYNWISQGMSATAISDLSKTSSIEVISKMERDTAMEELKLSLSGLIAENQALEIGKWQGANFIFTGSYQVAGPKIRANATMLDVEKGVVVISIKIDGFLDEIFDFQDQIILGLISKADKLHLGGVSWLPSSREYVSVAENAIRPSLSAYEEFSLGYSLRSENKKAALDHYLTAINLEPNYLDALIEAGSTTIALSRDYNAGKIFYSKAERLLRERYEENTILMAQVLGFQGSLATHLRELDSADFFLTKAESIMDQFDEHSLNRSSLEYRWGNLFRAKKEYDTALYHYDNSLKYQPCNENRFSPNIVKIFIAQGQAYREAESYNSSIEIYNKTKTYLARHNKTESSLYADVLFNLGTTQKENGNFDEAMRSYQKAKLLYKNLGFEEDSNYFIFLGNMAGLLTDKKDWHGAQQLFGEAVDLARKTGNIQHKDFPNYIYLEALCFYIQSKNSQAGPLFRESYNVFTNMNLLGNKRDSALAYAKELGY